MTTIRRDSSNALIQEINSLRSVLTLTETEESWDTIAQGISRLTKLCNHGAHDFPAELGALIRTLSRPLNDAMCSERSRLSGAAIDLLSALASGLGNGFEPLLPLFFPTLLMLCTRTNKVFITRARMCIHALIENCQLPAILPYLSEASKDKSVSLRITATEGMLACLNCFNPPDLENEVRARLIEDVIKATARDASADVRKLSRKVFEAYKLLFPERVDKFIGPLSPVMKKYLDIRAKPTNSSRPQPPNKSSTSSVLPVDGQSKLGGIIADPRPDARDTMPPPQCIPVRRGPPARAPITTSRSASVVEDRKRITSAVSALPGISGASRPSSNVAGATLKPSRFCTSSVPPTSARRVGHSTMAVPATTSAGASRLDRPANDATTSDGPIRPSAALSIAMASRASVKVEAGGRTRVIGGARRVPLPPQAPKEAEIVSAKETSDEHSILESVVNAGQSVILSRSTSRPALSGLVTSKADQKPKPIPKSTIEKSSTIALPSSTSSKVVSKLATERSHKQTVRAVKVTHPTLAQLPHSKAANINRKGKDAVKPAWGRPASSNASIVAKGLSVRNTAQDTKPASRLNTGKVMPNDIPLPPSPKSERMPMSMLPPPEEDKEAPKAPRKMEVPSPPMERTSLDRHLEGPINTLVPALPVQEPVESTLTPQKPRATQAATPISTLLTSIQQGFVFTPYSPLSPPQTYLPLTPDDLVIGSPTPTFAHPSGANESQIPGTSLILATQADDAPCLNSTFAVNESKGGDDVEAQVLNNIEIN